MGNEKQNQEERKGLTLADVGIPDFTRDHWKRLSYLNRITQAYTIQEKPFSLDDPLSDQHKNYFIKSGLPDSLINYKADIKTNREFSHQNKLKEDLKPKLVRLERREFTWRELATWIRANASTDHARKTAMGKLIPVLSSPIETLPCPYETSNFTSAFLDVLNERRKPEAIHATSLAEWDGIQRLLQRHNYSGPRDREGLQSWDGFRATYPYYITLKRQGSPGVMA